MNKKLLAGFIFTISGGATYIALKVLKKRLKENNMDEVDEA